MLTRLGLENFKSWRGLELELAPLTFLFGTNSSGKTAVLQSLLMLKQTVEGFDRKQPINFGGGERDLVDLGSYQDIVYGHYPQNKFTIQLNWHSELPHHIPFSGNLMYRAQWRYHKDRVVVDRLTYHADEFKNSFFTTTYQPTNDSYTYRYVDALDNNREENSDKVSPQSCYQMPDVHSIFQRHDVNENKHTAMMENVIRPSQFNQYFELLMTSIHYLGPLREYPKRIYQWSGSDSNLITPQGENTVAALLASARQNGRLLEEVAEWLVKLGIVERFTVTPLDPNGRFYETRVKIGGIESALVDVGFGVSQVLPVITMLFFVPEGSIVLIEQPELHLHPGAQSQLADLFLHVAETRHLQVIVESHSQHILTRLQRRIAEAEHEFANPENIRLYFSQWGEAGSTIQPVQVDRFGQITNWPPGFFGDMGADLDAMSRAAIARRREELTRG